MEFHSFTTHVMALRYHNNKLFFGRIGTSLSGPTMCFSKKVIEAALAIDADVSAAVKYGFEEGYVKSLIGIREDRFLNELSAKMGKLHRRKGGEPMVIYGQQFPSVMRNQRYR